MKKAILLVALVALAMFTVAPVAFAQDDNGGNADSSTVAADPGDQSSPCASATGQASATSGSASVSSGSASQSASQESSTALPETGGANFVPFLALGCVAFGGLAAYQTVRRIRES